MYDFANTIFCPNITTVFFPMYLTEVMGTNEVMMQQIASTFVTYSNAIASLLLVLISPLFGTWIDRTGKKKAYLVPFTLICIGFTVMMGASSSMANHQVCFGLKASIIGSVVLFILAQFFYNSCPAFYDSMISDLGTKTGYSAHFRIWRRCRIYWHIGWSRRASSGRTRSSREFFYPKRTAISPILSAHDTALQGKADSKRNIERKIFFQRV